jgi:uncharacterized membrane protein
MTTPNAVPPLPVLDVTSDDRLWVLLCFLFTPLFPIITLIIEDKKNRPFIKYHTIPTLVLGVAEIIVVFILGWIPIIGMFVGLLWIINLIYGIKANGGVLTDIPVITDFVKKQGW